MHNFFCKTLAALALNEPIPDPIDKTLPAYATIEAVSTKLRDQNAMVGLYIDIHARFSTHTNSERGNIFTSFVKYSRKTNTIQVKLRRPRKSARQPVVAARWLWAT